MEEVAAIGARVDETERAHQEMVERNRPRAKSWRCVTTREEAEESFMSLQRMDDQVWMRLYGFTRTSLFATTTTTTTSTSTTVGANLVAVARRRARPPPPPLASE